MSSSKSPARLRVVPARVKTDRPQIRPAALVVEPHLTLALSILSVLSARGFHVTLADNFLDAKGRLLEQPPDLLITAIMLGEYNGLGLILRGKSLRPDMAALALANGPDPVLQADAEDMGATFVQKPVSETELTAAIIRTLHRQTDAAASPIRAPFERRIRTLRSEAVLQFDERRLPDMPGLPARPSPVFRPD